MQDDSYKNFIEIHFRFLHGSVSAPSAEVSVTVISTIIMTVSSSTFQEAGSKKTVCAFSGYSATE